MRFTVKAKLASAFGLVIILSAVAGGVAYTKLGDMMAIADGMVTRAARMEKATVIEKDILLQVRAEKNSILANEAQVERFAADAAKLRESVTKIKDEVYALASEAGKKLLDGFAVSYAKMNAYQEETIRLVRTNKVMATERSMGDGRKVVADAMEAMDAYVDEHEEADGGAGGPLKGRRPTGATHADHPDRHLAGRCNRCGTLDLDQHQPVAWARGRSGRGGGRRRSHPNHSGRQQRRDRRSRQVAERDGREAPSDRRRKR